jgi:hypothetical protein
VRRGSSRLAAKSALAEQFPPFRGLYVTLFCRQAMQRAPISDGDAKDIAAYLAANYGT